MQRPIFPSTPRRIKVKKAEIELGKLYYRDYAVGEEMDNAEYLPWCQKIDESKKAIAELKDGYIASVRTEAEAQEAENADFDIVVTDDEPKAEEAEPAAAPEAAEEAAPKAPAEEAPKTEE